MQTLADVTDCSIYVYPVLCEGDGDSYVQWISIYVIMIIYNSKEDVLSGFIIPYLLINLHI